MSALQHVLQVRLNVLNSVSDRPEFLGLLLLEEASQRELHLVELGDLLVVEGAREDQLPEYGALVQDRVVHVEHLLERSKVSNESTIRAPREHK